MINDEMMHKGYWKVCRIVWYSAPPPKQIDFPYEISFHMIYGDKMNKMCSVKRIELMLYNISRNSLIKNLNALRALGEKTWLTMLNLWGRSFEISRLNFNIFSWLFCIGLLITINNWASFYFFNFGYIFFILQ